MKKGRIIQQEIIFESIEDILEYARERGCQVFIVQSTVLSVYIGRFGEIKVFESDFGCIDILGLSEQQKDIVLNFLDGSYEAGKMTGKIDENQTHRLYLENLGWKYIPPHKYSDFGVYTKKVDELYDRRGIEICAIDDDNAEKLYTERQIAILKERIRTIYQIGFSYFTNPNDFRGYLEAKIMQLTKRMENKLNKNNRQEEI